MSMEKKIEEAVRWIREHQERFWAVTGTALLSTLFIALVIHHKETESDTAWYQLGPIQGELAQNKFDDVRKNLESWESHYQGTDAATFAKFLKADLLYNTSDYAGATQVYADLVQTGHPDVVKPLALAAEASSEEMAGHIPQALSLSQTFLDKYPDHFLAAPRYMAQARLLELTGDRAGAAVVYDRFVLLFPQSPWTDLARSRSQTLAKK